MAKRIDLTGQRFGRLSVLAFAGVSPSGRAVWTCKCDCGAIVDSVGKDLRAGKIQSCGCARKEHCREHMQRMNTTHGKRYTRLYTVWRDMKLRCQNPGHKSYPGYGGRGIRVCPEWQDFGAFFSWAMAAGYNPDAPFGTCTLDRIDTNGNYEPSNCRWVDMKVQASNRRPATKAGCL